MAFLAMMGILVAGCVSKSEIQAKQRAAFLAGQQQGAAAAKAAANSVLFMGNVRNPAVPWTPDLTLRQAMIQADYAGPGDPSQIIVTRTGTEPVVVSPAQLLAGFDMPLLAGDRIEVRR
jgi:hypothetical protein